jgi:molybdate transport system regulatory protein
MVYSSRSGQWFLVPASATHDSERVLKPVFRLWLEDSEKAVVLDQTDAALLRYITETGSLTHAAKIVGMSYRNAWDRMERMEKNLGHRLVERKAGGRAGGSATVTEEGRKLLKEFRKTRKLLFNILDDKEAWEDVGYRLSARNRLRAKVVEVKQGAVTSQVKMRLVSANTLTSIITNEAVEDLSLEEGDEVEAIVKSTDVLVAKGRQRRG